jgi:hypothetical protein
VKLAIVREMNFKLAQALLATKSHHDEPSEYLRLNPNGSVEATNKFAFIVCKDVFAPFEGSPKLIRPDSFLTKFMIRLKLDFEKKVCNHSLGGTDFREYQGSKPFPVLPTINETLCELTSTGNLLNLKRVSLFLQTLNAYDKAAYEHPWLYVHGGRFLRYDYPDGSMQIICAALKPDGSLQVKNPLNKTFTPRAHF